MLLELDFNPISANGATDDGELPQSSTASMF